MNFCDSHIHVGNFERVKKILNETKFINKYKLYTAIDPMMINETNTYIKEVDDFFAMPIIFKEINIEQENEFLKEYCSSLGKGVPVEIINNNSFFNENNKLPIFKEHFLINDFNDWQQRTLYYEYLNKKSGYLILHCKDRIRIEYINNLLNNFPKMNIIIAHLGRDTFETNDFITKVLYEYQHNPNIYFDISTIKDFNNIKQAFNIIGSNRILYGSDFPYDFDRNYEIKKLNDLKRIFDSNKDYNNVIGENFGRIKAKIYTK